MPYTSVEEIYEAIDTEFPDNIVRAITPERVRTVLHGIVEYFATYTMYKPSIIPVGTNAQQIIALTADLLAEYGRFPEPLVFFGDDVNGYVLTAIPWSVDQAPPNTTQIILELGANPPAGFILLK